MAHLHTLITGSNGFVGRVLCARLDTDDVPIRRAQRRAGEKLKSDIVIGDIGESTNWDEALDGIDLVIHLAARAHILQESASKPLDAFRAVNTAGTLRLAKACASKGVKRLVYVSSCGVHGPTSRAAPFTEDSPIRAESPYAQSKWEAEQALQALNTNLEIVILRPPLIHGPYVRGNFLRLLNWVHRGIPLPFGAIANRRSFLGVDNFVDALVHCAIDPNAAGQTFLISDGEDLSTPELLRAIAQRLERPSRLIPCPQWPMRLAARCFGRGADIDRLFGSLQIDASHIRKTLDWVPPFTVDQGLDRMCAWYRQNLAQREASAA